MTFGAAPDWDGVEELTLPRVEALYRKWRRYPPPALAWSIRLQIKGEKKRRGLGDFLSDCGFDVKKRVR